MRKNLIPVLLQEHAAGQLDSLENIHRIGSKLALEQSAHHNLWITDTSPADPLDFRSLGSVETMDVRGSLARLRDYPDQPFIRRDVIRPMLHVMANRTPTVFHLKATIQDHVAVYDKLIIQVGSYNVTLVQAYLVLRVFTEEQLAPREEQLLDLLASGYSAKEIGLLTKVSFRTVETQIAQLREKIGARNTAHAAAIGTARRLTRTNGERPDRAAGGGRGGT